VLLGVIDYGLDIQEAVDSPRFHNQWLPDRTGIEANRFSPDTIRLLEHKGQTLRLGDPTSEKPDRDPDWGDAECIMIDPKTGERLGGHDERRGSYGKAAGF
jgi:gamma-glutamyltranspeptidase / glutathione hydrolase